MPGFWMFFCKWNQQDLLICLMWGVIDGEETEMVKNWEQAPGTTEFPSTESRTASGAIGEGFAEWVGAIRSSVLDLLV